MSKNHIFKITEEWKNNSKVNSEQYEKLYKDYFQEPLFTGGKIKKEFHPDSVLNFFYNTILK